MNKTCVLLVAVLLLLGALSSSVSARGKLISAPSRVDMVYDDARSILYITNGDSVLRYDLNSNTFLSPFVLGGQLKAIDVSPDGNTLAVADTSTPRIHLVNLLTGQTTRVNFTPASGEGGTFSVAYGSDGKILTSSTFNGSGWVPLRRYDPVTQTTTTLASIRHGSMLCASADRSVIGFEESDTSDGPFGRYRVSDGNLLRKSGYANGTSWFNYEIGANRNGTQYALPTYGGCFICDVNMVKYDNVGTYAGAQPIGVVYHPLQDIVYFAWATTTKVRAYDTGLMTLITEYDFQNTFDHPGNSAFVEGRLKISRDGNLLFATVAGGVRYIRINNTAPTANSQSVNTTEDTSVGVTLSGSDPGGDPLTYVVVANPAHGALSGTAPNLTYTPAANYSGSDSFTFKVNDGDLDSSLATVSISVSPVNDPPVANAKTVTTQEDTAANVTLTASDPDGNPLTYSVVTPPQHGALGGTAPSLTYTPAANYNGPDSFTFKVNDRTVDSASALVSITITSVNDAPVADPQSVTTDEDSPANITLTGSDVEGSTLTYTVASLPSHGALSGSAPDLVYTPTADSNGPDSFTFRVSDGLLNSALATVSISVNPVNDPPFANPLSALTVEDISASINLSGWDLDGDPIICSVVDGPLHGILTGTLPNLTYLPTANYNGPDSFTFKANDGSADSIPAAVNIAIAPVNDPPDFALAGTEVTAKRHKPSVVIPSWAVNITPGPADESGQTIGFEVNNNRPDLFLVQPSIDSTGQLTFEAARLKGTASVVVYAHDNGGTLNGGIDECSPKSFTITIK